MVISFSLIGCTECMIFKMMNGCWHSRLSQFLSSLAFILNSTLCYAPFFLDLSQNMKMKRNDAKALSPLLRLQKSIFPQGQMFAVNCSEGKAAKESALYALPNGTLC